MSTASLYTTGRVNLAAATALLLDRNAGSVNILVQVLSGFGVYKFVKCTHSDEAKRAIGERQVDLVVMDPGIEDGAGYDFVRWLRTQKMDPNSYVPVILTSGHTQPQNVQRGLNAGASYLIVKPLSPAVLLERILWVAHENKPFIETADYLGPDRRVRVGDPPAGVAERRRASPGASRAFRPSDVEVVP